MVPSMSKKRPGRSGVFKSRVVVDELSGVPWRLVWQRRRVPQTGGQNYSLDNYAVAPESASGPLNIIARPFQPLEATSPYATRQIPNNGFGGTSQPNGQVFSQPLFDDDSGGFTKALTPIYARPFDINRILPAGKA